MVLKKASNSWAWSGHRVFLCAAAAVPDALPVLKVGRTLRTDPPLSRETRSSSAPAAVSGCPSWRRMNSSAPTAASSARTRRITVTRLTPSVSAAFSSAPASLSATKTRTSSYPGVLGKAAPLSGASGRRRGA